MKTVRNVQIQIQIQIQMKSILIHFTPQSDQGGAIHKSSGRSNKSEANTNRDRTSGGKAHKKENKLQR